MIVFEVPVHVTTSFPRQQQQYRNSCCHSCISPKTYALGKQKEEVNTAGA
jgi:hypothetical protein